MSPLEVMKYVLYVLIGIGALEFALLILASWLAMRCDNEDEHNGMDTEVEDDATHSYVNKDDAP